MDIRVPLIAQTSVAVIYRLDPTATAAVDPPGPDAAGYDPVFREPIVYDNAGTRTSARRELAPVRVPCQVEAARFEELRQQFSGDAPNSNVVLVLHRQDLETLGLLDPTTRKLLIAVNDRVSGLERSGAPGQVVQPFVGEGLFVFEVRPASFGFGPDGHDLELLYLNDREKARAA